jgi:hypothetical protein
MKRPPATGEKLMTYAATAVRHGATFSATDGPPIKAIPLGLRG